MILPAPGHSIMNATHHRFRARVLYLAHKSNGDEK